MKDNCFNEFDPNALNVEEALSRILKSIASKKDTELVPLKASYGRVLAKDIKSNKIYLIIKILLWMDTQCVWILQTQIINILSDVLENLSQVVHIIKM